MHEWNDHISPQHMAEKTPQRQSRVLISVLIRSISNMTNIKSVIISKRQVTESE